MAEKPGLIPRACGSGDHWNSRRYTVDLHSLMLSQNWKWDTTFFHYHFDIYGSRNFLRTGTKKSSSIYYFILDSYNYLTMPNKHSEPTKPSEKWNTMKFMHFYPSFLLFIDWRLGYREILGEFLYTRMFQEELYLGQLNNCFRISLNLYICMCVSVCLSIYMNIFKYLNLFAVGGG